MLPLRRYVDCLRSWHLRACSVRRTRAGFPPRKAASRRRSRRLSEPGGYFDTDNLISNERSYLQVVPLERAGSGGGVYLGVGPDQNFSYIAACGPDRFIVDIRRDNLLLHLLFKALLEQAHARVEYRRSSSDGRACRWRPLGGSTGERLAVYIDGQAAGLPGDVGRSGDGRAP